MSKNTAKQTPAAGRLGRPLKEAKFDAQISFPCHGKMIEGIEDYRRKHGMRSQGEVCRRLIQWGLKNAVGLELDK